MERLTAFHLFPKLPYDIQYEIWKHASHFIKPRIVEIGFDHNKEKFTTNAPCPVLLHVCQTSRRAISLEWPFCFGVAKSEAHGHRFGESEARIPFNFAIDTLCFDKSFLNVSSLLKLEERERVTEVAWAIETEKFARIVCFAFGAANGPNVERALKAARQLVETFPNVESLKWTFGRRICGWSYWSGAALEMEDILYGLTPREIPYSDHWGLDMDPTKGMLPHYLYLTDYDPRYRLAYFHQILESVRDSSPELALKLPKVSFALATARLISVEQDSWGFDITPPRIEEEKRMRAKRDAAEKRLEVLNCKIDRCLNGSERWHKMFAERKMLAKRLDLLSYLDYESKDTKEKQIYRAKKSVVQHLHRMRYRRKLE